MAHIMHVTTEKCSSKFLYDVKYKLFIIHSHNNMYPICMYLLVQYHDLQIPVKSVYVFAFNVFQPVHMMCLCDKVVVIANIGLW